MVETWLVILLFGVSVGQQCEEECYTSQCPNTWTYYKGSCYLFADNIMMDWTEAAHHCSSLHGSLLVTIESKSEDYFLQQYANRLFKNVEDRHHQDPFFWVGATEMLIEGIWTWYVNDEELDQTYSNWFPGQPDSYHHTDQDCLSLHGQNNFTWHDLVCSRTDGFPLCELRYEGVVYKNFLYVN